MESGRQIKKAALLLAGVFVLLNLLLASFYYANYQRQLETVAIMLTADNGSSLDKAVAMLKGNTLTAAGGQELLAQYGYLQNNAFIRQFYQQVLLTAGLSLVLLALLLLGFVCCLRRLQKDNQALLLQVENSLMQFRSDSSGRHEQGEQQQTANKEHKLLRQPGDELSEQYVRQQVGRELPELERLNQQLAALADNLQYIREQAQAEKEATKELVTDISHQLKTPVAALDTCLSVLQQENLNEDERAEFYSRCRQALDGLEVLLQSLLQISKLEAGLIQVELQPEKIMETIIAAVNRVYPKAAAKEIEIAFDYQDALADTVITHDRKWLGEAVINILDNAIKYSPPGSEITISMQQRSALLRLEFADQGIGIPREEYHKIFQRFYRGTARSVAEANGSGVGLYLAREIIEKHHGTITVASAYENSRQQFPGSTFIIQLPSA